MERPGTGGRKSNVGTRKKTTLKELGTYFVTIFDRHPFSVRLGPGAEKLYPLMSKEDIRHVAKTICRSAVRNAK